ncbi:MAG: hypothetical protein ACXAC8_13690 [Candidatus Hodarchaeales archaeon]
MWDQSKLFEEVGMQLLLLSIFLFRDFYVFENNLLLITREDFHKKHIQILLRLLSMTTGHSFYAKKSKESHDIRIFCLDKPDYFQRLLQINYVIKQD